MPSNAKVNLSATEAGLAPPMAGIAVPCEAP